MDGVSNTKRFNSWKGSSWSLSTLC